MLMFFTNVHCNIHFIHSCFSFRLNFVKSFRKIRSCNCTGHYNHKNNSFNIRVMLRQRGEGHISYAQVFLLQKLGHKNLIKNKNKHLAQIFSQPQIHPTKQLFAQKTSRTSYLEFLLLYIYVFRLLVKPKCSFQFLKDSSLLNKCQRHYSFLCFIKAYNH